METEEGIPRIYTIGAMVLWFVGFLMLVFSALSNGGSKAAFAFAAIVFIALAVGTSLVTWHKHVQIKRSE